MRAGGTTVIVCIALLFQGKGKKSCGARLETVPGKKIQEEEETRVREVSKCGRGKQVKVHINQFASGR